MDDEPVLLTVGEAATRLAMSKWKVYELVAAGDLTKKYIGARNFRLDRKDVDEYAASLPTEPPIVE